MKPLADHTIIENIFTSSEATLTNDRELLKNLSSYINDLIIHDFERLVSILYRIDVNEKKIKQMLQEQQGVDAAETIARLIIERQLQKLKSRRENRRDQEDVDTEERW